MKNFFLSFLFIFLIASCKKESSNSNNDNNTGKHKWSRYFLPDIGGDIATITSLVSDTAGRIYIGGSFSSYNWYGQILRFDSVEVNSFISLNARPRVYSQKLAIDNSNNLYAIDEYSVQDSLGIGKYNGNSLVQIADRQNWHMSEPTGACSDKMGNIYYAIDVWNYISGQSHCIAKFNGSNYEFFGDALGTFPIVDICCDNFGKLYALRVDYSNNSQTALLFKVEGNNILTQVPFIPNERIVSIPIFDGIKYLYVNCYNPNTNQYSIARYDGINWEKILDWQNYFPNYKIVLPTTNVIITGCSDKNGNVYFIVYDYLASTNNTNYNHIIKWDGKKWSEIEASNVLFSYALPPSAICCDKKGNIYIGVPGAQPNGQCFLVRFGD